MKTLKFRPSLVKPILNGEKDTTWRLFDDKNISKGDQLSLVNWRTKEEFAQAEVVSVTEKSLKELTDEDWQGHEKYKSKQEMYDTYSTYYHKPINENTEIKIIKFKVKKSI